MEFSFARAHERTHTPSEMRDGSADLSRNPLCKTARDVNSRGNRNAVVGDGNG
jgi:hypothetical protein